MFSDSKKFVGEGLTYDDVLLVPAYSEIIPRDVRVNSMFSRNIAVNIPIVSASQTNRGGYNAAEVGLNDIADSFGVTQKADAIISVTQTPEFKDQGIYQLKLLKTRYGNNKEQVATIGVSIEKQRIYDLNSGAAQQTTANIFTATKSKNNGDEDASNMLNDIEL